MGTKGETAEAAASRLRPSSVQNPAEVGEPSAAEATWAAMTIPHHKAGIALADLAVARSSSEEVRQLAQKSKEDQEKDLPILEQIVGAAGKTPMPPEAAIEAMQQQHTALLSSLSGSQFDRRWLDVFRSHHVVAVLTAGIAAAGSTSGVAHRLEQSTRTGQLGQIQRINELIEQLQ